MQCGSLKILIICRNSDSSVETLLARTIVKDGLLIILFVALISSKFSSPQSVRCYRSLGVTQKCTHCMFGNVLAQMWWGYADFNIKVYSNCIVYSPTSLWYEVYLSEQASWKRRPENGFDITDDIFGTTFVSKRILFYDTEIEFLLKINEFYLIYRQQKRVTSATNESKDDTEYLTSSKDDKNVNNIEIND